MHIVLTGTVLKKDGTIFLFLILGMMEKVLGGTMGVLKHDVTMVTGMIDKLKGRALPERNISDDGRYQRQLGAKTQASLLYFSNFTVPILRKANFSPLFFRIGKPFGRRFSMNTALNY